MSRVCMRPTGKQPEEGEREAPTAPDRGLSAKRRRWLKPAAAAAAASAPMLAVAAAGTCAAAGAVVERMVVSVAGEVGVAPWTV